MCFCIWYNHVTIGNINTIRYAERRIKGEDVMDKKEMMASKDVVLKQDAAADEEKVSEQKTVTLRMLLLSQRSRLLIHRHT